MQQTISSEDVEMSMAGFGRVPQRKVVNKEPVWCTNPILAVSKPNVIAQPVPMHGGTSVIHGKHVQEHTDLVGSAEQPF